MKTFRFVFLFAIGFMLSMGSCESTPIPGPKIDIQIDDGTKMFTGEYITLEVKILDPPSGQAIYKWSTSEGEELLTKVDEPLTKFQAPDIPGEVTVRVDVTIGNVPYSDSKRIIVVPKSEENATGGDESPTMAEIEAAKEESKVIETVTSSPIPTPTLTPSSTPDLSLTDLPSSGWPFSITIPVLISIPP